MTTIFTPDDFFSHDPEDIQREARAVATDAYRTWEAQRVRVRRPPIPVSVRRQESPEREALGELARQPRCVVCHNHIDADDSTHVCLSLLVHSFPYFQTQYLCSPLCRRAFYYESSRTYRRFLISKP